KNVGAQHPLLRRLLGRDRLNSITYQRIMRWNARCGATQALDRLRGVHAEAVIQDIDIPIGRAAEFLAFLHAEVGLLPIWICPIPAAPPGAETARFPHSARPPPVPSRRPIRCRAARCQSISAFGTPCARKIRASEGSSTER